jgi:D-arginine dehydrogenase
MRAVDVIVIGGGIAGATAAAHLAEGGARVVLLEAEDQLAHHTTGRSAAQYLENYGGPVNVALTLASRPSFEAGPYLSPRAMLSVGGEADLDELERLAAVGARLVPSIRLVDGDEARRWCPVLRPELVAGGVIEPDAADIDVALLHADYVSRARRAGAEIVAGHRVREIRADGNGWRVDDRVTDVVVDAAGAWADEVATLAGARRLGLRPLRRTAFVTAGPEGSGAWPLVHGVDDTWYFKPEAGPSLLCSPADETPSEPCDARPEEIDVARAIDHIQRWTTLDLRHVRRAWAGLRTFAPDRSPVIGFDPEAPGFFWLAGQGGTGIQTAPAQGMATAGLVLDGHLPDALTARGLSPEQLGPARLRTGGPGPAVGGPLGN